MHRLRRSKKTKNNIVIVVFKYEAFTVLLRKLLMIKVLRATLKKVNAIAKHVERYCKEDGGFEALNQGTFRGINFFYTTQYYEAKTGKYKLLGQEISSPREFKKVTSVVQSTLGVHWQASKFSEIRAPALAYRNDQSPRATVLVSLYQSAKFLDFFLSQLSSQTVLQEIEIVFLAAKPSAKECRLLKKFNEVVMNSQVIVYEKPVSVYKAWNDGIKATSAPLITNMNVDDIRSSYSIETQISFMESNARCDIVYQNFYLSILPNLSFNAIELINQKVDLPEDLDSALKSGFNLPHHAPMWRRKVHEYIGYFDETYISAGDYDFWIRAHKAGAVFMKDDEWHTGYFLNPQGLSSRVLSQGAQEAKIIRKKHNFDS